MRRPLVVGNWKMNGSRADNAALLGELVSLKSQRASTETPLSEMAVCTPAVYLEQAERLLANQGIDIGGQDVSVHLNGAYTGEISAAMLVDISCRYVIVGHSERRQYHHESNLLVAQKTLSALQAGLIPILCVGETLEQREANQTLEVVGEQLSAVKTVIGDNLMGNLVVAYEPVWAIGTGLTATPEQAQDVHGFIRSQLGAVAQSVCVLYGGSVKANNAKELFAQPDIDGALVGGASLVANDFIDIASAF